MDIQEILYRLNKRPGQNLGALWKRPLKVLKKYEDTVEKITACKIRTGIEYDNQLIVQMRREIGERPAKNAGLPWGEWQTYPYIIAYHGNLYVRLYPASDRFALNPAKAQEDYIINGRISTEKEARQICQASEFYDKDKRDCWVVNVDYLISLG